MLHRIVFVAALPFCLSVSKANAQQQHVRTNRVLQTAVSTAVTSLRLIQATTDTDIGAMQDNQVIYLGDYPPGASFNIQALASGTPKSIRFAYNGNPNFQTENSAPYAFCGNSGPDYAPCKVLGLGNHTVTATPFPDTKAGGLAGTARTVRFTIVAGSAPGTVPKAAPTAPPKAAPTAPPKAPPTTAPKAPPTAAPKAPPTVAPVSLPTPPTASCKVPKLVGNWETKTKYPISAGEAQGGIIANDMIVLSGFTQGIAQATPECYALNLNDPTAVWRRMDDIPIPQGITHAAVVVVGMKFYMCGGFIGGHPGPHTDLCFVYDHSIAPGSGQQWKSLPPLPDGRSGGGLLYSKVRDALFFAGGAERPTSSTYIDYQHTWMLPLDGSSGWILKQDLPYASNHLSYVTALDHLGAEHHYVLGGQMGGNEANGNVDDVYEWDAIKEVWIKRQNLLFARGHASASTRAISCGFIIVSGTRNGSGLTRDISYYDIPSNNWTKVGDMWTGVNTPVCGIDFVNGYLRCETGWADGKFSTRIRIEV